MRRTKRQNSVIRNYRTAELREVRDIIRQIYNTGYSGGGASTKKNYSRGWDWRGGSHVEDINNNLSVLRQRSRDLWANAPIARAALLRIRDNAVGSGLRLQSTPRADILGITDDEASAWARKLEWEFQIWAESRSSDALGLNTFSENLSLMLLSWLQSGDCFVLLPMQKTDNTIYELKMHVIEADRVCNPAIVPPGVRIEHGVEIDEDGMTVAYWIKDTHPLSSNNLIPIAGNWKRVPVKDEKTGRLNILHMIITERPEQRRGVPLLSPVIESLKQLTRYAEAELMAAVVSGLLTVFIKSEIPQTPLGESIPDSMKVSKNAVDENYQAELGPGAVVGLGVGEDISSVNPMRPNTAFDAFTQAICREIGAAIGVPYEVMMQAFTASYSASRAALLDFWKTARYWREALIRNVCVPIFKEFAWEAVLKGRIEAEGFIDDEVRRNAWLESQWHGPAMGQIDPLKEIQAADRRIRTGVSTLAREAMELTGSDWDTNIAQLGIEKQRKIDANIFVEDDSTRKDIKEEEKWISKD